MKSPVRQIDPDLLKVGYFELIPHIEKNEEGVLVGPALDYAKRVLQEMQIKRYELKGYPLQRGFQMLQQGQIDMLLFAAKTPHALQDDLVLSDLSITFIQPGLVVKKDSTLSAPLEYSQLVDKRLAYWGGGYIPELLQQDSTELIAVAGGDVYKRGFKLLQYDRVDGFFHADSMALQWWLANTSATEGLKLLTLPNRVNVKSVFSQKSAVRYKERYEKALETVQTTLPYRNLFINYKKPPRFQP